MKFNEFKKKVEELNCEFVAEITNDKAAIYVMGKHDEILAKIDNRCLGVMDLNFYATQNLNEEIRLRLLDLLYEFAKTPLDERFEEDKYYLEYKGSLILSYWSEIVYLNQWREKEEVFELDNHEDSKSHRTKFTQKEIDELPEEFKMMIEKGYLEKVKVDE